MLMNEQDSNFINWFIDYDLDDIYVKSYSNRSYKIIKHDREYNIFYINGEYLVMVKTNELNQWKYDNHYTNGFDEFDFMDIREKQEIELWKIDAINHVKNTKKELDLIIKSLSYTDMYESRAIAETLEQIKDETIEFLNSTGLRKYLEVESDE